MEVGKHYRKGGKLAKYSQEDGLFSSVRTQSTKDGNWSKDVDKAQENIN